MRGHRPFASNIAPALDELIEQACYICERASLPRREDIDRLRELGKKWDEAGSPLVTDITTPESK